MVRFGGFTFDPDSGELREGERPVKLHPQPAQVLALLLRRAGEIVTREEIREELWGDDTFVDYDLGINSCIRQIRSALRDDADAPRFVQTIPRKGYRFVLGLEGASEAGRQPPRLRAAIWLGAAAFIAALLVALVRLPREADRAPSPDESSIAVLPFDNLSGDASLDWLRTGLADMVVTDLGRLSTVDVVSTDRLLRILDEADALDAAMTTEPIVQVVAEETGAGRMLLGSFLKAGENIRINVRVRDARSGAILTAAMVEGSGESGIFSMVDDLSQRLRATLALPSAGGSEHLLSFADYSTSSLEAYRYYVEGRNLMYRSKSAEALLLYKKAAEEDPDWARAVNMVAMMYSNIGLEKEAEDYARRAFELAERLDQKERYSIEAFYYALREETYGQAIEKMREHIELMKETATNHVLARRLFLLERVDEAIAHWGIVTEAQIPIWMAYRQLAEAYAHQERFEDAYELIESFLTRFPDRAEAYAGLGEHWVRAGRLEAALEAFQKAEALDPARPGTEIGRFQLAVLQEDWREAEAAVKPLTSLRSPTLRWEGLRRLALVSLYRGESGQSLELLDRAASVYEHPRSRSADARVQAAQVLLAAGKAERALDLARSAQREGEGNYPEWEGLRLEALALEAMGRMEAAKERASKLEERTRSMPTEKEDRRHHLLVGQLALAAGEAEAAIDELEKARSMLLPRGFTVMSKDPPQHVPIWFSLGLAYLEAGREDEAQKWLERVAGSESEHIWWPIPYVRSFYFLGRIHESRGDSERAGEFYRRFHEYWRAGDLDRARVEEARNKRTPAAIAAARRRTFGRGIP